MRKYFDFLGMTQLASIAGAVIAGISIIYISETVNADDIGYSSVNNNEFVALYEEETTTYIEESAGNIPPETTLHVEITSETETTTVHVAEITSEEALKEETTIKETTIKETKKATQKETTSKKKTTTTTKKPMPTTTKFKGGDISTWINPNGNTVTTRFKVPKNYTRLTYEKGSYADYVNSLPLEYYGRKMYEYDGKLAENQGWNASVIKTEFHSKGWLQCADCVMKLLGDYLYDNGRADEIVFDLASGKRLSYSNWSGGSYEKYMSNVYMNANTSSLKAQKESVKLSIKDIFPGAYFIMDKDKKHEYGHAIYVIDVARNDKGEVAFLLAQGSTPSQDMYIFQNPLHPDDPWYYSSEIGSTFEIPGWTFKTSNLYYYKPIGKQKALPIEEPTVPQQTTVGGNNKFEDEETTIINKENETEQTTTIDEKETIEKIETSVVEKETIETTTETSSNEETMTETSSAEEETTENNADEMSSADMADI